MPDRPGLTTPGTYSTVGMPMAVSIGEEERAGTAEAERLVREAEFGARELGGWSFLVAGRVALGMTAF